MEEEIMNPEIYEKYKKSFIISAIFSLLVIMAMAVALVSASITHNMKSLDYITNTYDYVRGFIVDMNDDYIYINNDRDPNPDYFFNREAVCKDSYADFKDGDYVDVFYDGAILNTRPAQLETTMAVVQRYNAQTMKE